MTIPFEQLGEEIANTLMAANYKVEMYDDENNRVYEKQAARKFFTRPGNHMITIHNEGNEKSTLKVFLSSPVNIKKFQKRVGGKLQKIATRIGDNMSYDIRTFGKELTPKDFAHNKMREEFEMNDKRVDEAYNKMTGTSRSSYQKIGECRLIVRHVGRVNESKFGSRSRNIASIYVETKNGERFRMVENSLHGARAMARHLSNSGNPFDVVGKKISGMMEEMASLRDMIKEVRSISKNDVLSEEGNALSQQIREKYVGLRETLRKMSGKFGYMTQSAALAEEEKLNELKPEPWGNEISIRKQLGREPMTPGDDADTALAYGSHDKAIALTPPSTGSEFTGADRSRIEREAAATWLMRVQGISSDPEAPEHASAINSALASEAFLQSDEYRKYQAKMGENIAEDEFDVMLDELYDDSMDPGSGTEKGPMDLEVLRQLPPMKQFSLLMGEILSPDPHGNPQIDGLKKEVEALLRNDDEAFNYWGRANDNIAHGDQLQSDGEKQAAQYAAHLLKKARLGNFDRVVVSLKVTDTPHKPWGEVPGDAPTFEAKQVGGKWGNERASDIEDRIHKKMAKKDIQAGRKRKEREPDKYDAMAKKYGVESVQEAEAEGKISSAEQKYEYTSNTTEFDRPTDGKKAHITTHVITDLSRDKFETMHSENDVEIAKGGGKQKEYPLPEHAVLESWFNDMAHVEFFNEKELKDEKEEDIQEVEEILPETAFNRLNFYIGHPLFERFLNYYKENGVLDKIIDLVEEDSKLWKAINEGKVNAMWMDEQERKIDLAFAELENIVQRRAQSIESAIQELAQGFDDPDSAAEELHVRAAEAGLDKSDFGSTFADDVLSPNEEVKRGKEENKAEEFYGRAKFGEGENEEVDRIRELAGLNDERQIDEYPGPESNMGGSSQGEVYDPETNELIGSVWQVGPGNWEIEHNLSGMTWDMHDTEPDAIEHLQQIHNEHGAHSQYMDNMDTDPGYYESVDRIQELAGIAKKKNDDVEEGRNDHVMGPGYEDKNAYEGLEEYDMSGVSREDAEAMLHIARKKGIEPSDALKEILAGYGLDDSGREMETEAVTDQNLARIIQLSKYKS